MIITGQDKLEKLPNPIKLYNRDLPWVERAVHLGHTLHYSGNMDLDISIRRAMFIDRSVEVREELSYADPEMIIKALGIYCCDSYGSMIWDLQSDKAESYFKAWNTAIKLLYNIPRSTHTYLVEGFLAGNSLSLRNQVLSRIPGFLQSLWSSPSKEIRCMIRILRKEVESVTYRNYKYVEKVSGLNPFIFGKSRVKSQILRMEIPEKQEWRKDILQTLIPFRKIRGTDEDKDRLNSIIELVCSI